LEENNLEQTTAKDARERIIDAATQLFSQKGFDATRVNDIANTANVNKALIYYYFKSKEDILALLVYKVKYKFIHIPIQIMVVIGLYFLCFDGNSFVFGKGEVTALITAISIAGALVFGEESLKKLDALAVSAVQAGITALISLPCALIFESTKVLSRVTLPAWLVVLYLAVFCTNIAYMLQNSALKNISASAVSMLQCTQPILTALISYFLLGEKLSSIGIIGAAIIIICIIAENIINAKEQPSHSHIENPT
jgi:drug/metabolite transporter (DMT)-like permease